MNKTIKDNFYVGQKVKTLGDMGEFNLIITKIHNDHYCEATGYGKKRHFNMNYLEPKESPKCKICGTNEFHIEPCANCGKQMCDNCDDYCEICETIVCSKCPCNCDNENETND